MFGLSSDQLAFFQKAFNLFTQGNTCMNSDQLGLVMSSLGSDLSKVQLQDLVTEIDLNGDGTIDFEEFLTLVFRKIRGSIQQELFEAYRQFDRDSNQLITQTQLKDAMAKCGFAPSPEELSGIMQQADYDMDGLISFEDFCQLLIGNSNSD